MRRLLTERPTPNHVRAVFQTSAAFFDLPPVATFADLADRLCLLGERHAGALTSIDIQAEGASDMRTLEAASWRRFLGGDVKPKANPT